MRRTLTIAVVGITLCVYEVIGHGRLLDPPSRSTMWRLGYNTPENYDDNQLYCGGKTMQWLIFGGKCGPCGDSWADGNFGRRPRPNEAGGKYGTGLLVRSYQQASTMHAVVQLTASHLGFFEFKLCPTNDKKRRANNTCFDAHPVQVDGRKDYRYYVDKESAMYNITLRLPQDVHCMHCVFLWRYQAGNSWGKCSNGTRGLGCGAQEEFRGCADVRIVKSRKSIPSKLDLNNVCKGLSKGMLSDQKLNCDKIYNLGDVTCKNDSCRSLVKQILNLGSQCDDLTATMTSLKRHCHNTECYAEVLSVEEYSNVTVQKEQSKFKEFFNVTGDELAVPSCEICNSPFSRYLNVYAVCKARNFELNPLENFTEDSLLCRQKLKSLCYEISVGKIRLEDLCVKNSSRIIGIHEFCIGSNVDFEICDLDNSIASQRFCHNNSNSIAYDFSNPCESNPVDGIDANKFGDLCETSFSTTTRQNITFNEFCKNSSPKRTIQNRICSKFADFSKVVVKTSKNIAKISKALINLCRDADSNGLEEYGQLCFSLLTQNVRLIDRIKVIHLNHSMASNVGTKNVTVPTESAMVKYRCKYGNNLGDESEALAGDNVICEMMTEPDSQNITGELRNRNSSLETSTIQKVKETDQYKQAYQNIFKLISAGGEDEVEYLHHGSSVHSEYNHIDNLTMELVDEISAEVATVNRIAQSSTTQPNKTSNINSTGNNEDRPTHERYKMENVLQSGAENSTSETNAIYNELLQPDDKTKAKLEHVRQSDNELELGKNNETRNALTQEMSAASTQVVDDQEGGNDSISHRSEQMKQEDKNEQDSTIGNATMGQTMSAGSNSIDEIEEGNPGMFSEPTEKKDMRGEESMENDNVIAEGVDVSRNCVPKGLWRVVPDMDLWCLHNCAPATPSSACLHHCQCSHSDSDILKGFSFT